MSTHGNDPFFEDEEDVARAQATATPRASKAAPVASAASSKGARKPPSFGWVVAIAVVALLLGVGIGYFWAMAVVDHSPSSSSSTVTLTSTSEMDGEAVGMPEGHPDISSLMNPDGTRNEEALAAYRAEQAAKQGEEAQADTEADTNEDA